MTTSKQDIGQGTTARELAQCIGKHGIYSVTGDLNVEVEILDARVSWGWTQYLITPVAGSGSRWVQERLVIGD